MDFRVFMFDIVCRIFPYLRQLEFQIKANSYPRESQLMLAALLALTVYIV